MSSEMKPIYSVTGTTEVIDRSDGLGFHDQLLNEFHELDRKVREHAASALIFCDALMEICTRKLYEVDGFASWLDYCSSRNISVRHAQRLVNAGKIRREIATCDPGVALPTSEKHLRARSSHPRLRRSSQDAPGEGYGCLAEGFRSCPGKGPTKARRPARGILGRGGLSRAGGVVAGLA